MTNEWQLIEAQRDGSHVFAGDLNCTICGRPRCFHVHDGFKAGPTPQSLLSTDPQANYRGPHPAWSRPGTFSKLERHELAAEQKAKRAEIERAIAADKAKFKARARA